MDWQSNWHFVNEPYLDQGGTLDDFPDFKPPSARIYDALNDLTKFLKGDDIKDSVYIKTIEDHFPNEDDQKSFALRLVIHYTGDIHQPLHNTALVDHNYPSGDEGGNLENIPDKETPTGVNELHALWDSVIYDYPGYPDLPFDKHEWNSFT